MEKGRLEGLVEGEAIVLNEQSKLTKAQAKHVDALIKKHRRDLDAQFAAAVEAQVNNQVSARKDALDKAREAVAKQLNDAFKDQEHWKTLINKHKPIFAVDEFRARRALHPDRIQRAKKRARGRYQSVTDKNPANREVP